MIAVIVVRGGVLPAGADEAVAEAGGRALLAGDGTAAAAAALRSAVEVVRWAAGSFRPAAWSSALAAVLASDELIVLPASPDGRDLAARLAVAMDRPLLPGALVAGPDRVVLSGYDGRVAEEIVPARPSVVTLIPGSRGGTPLEAAARVTELVLEVPPAHDAEVLSLSPPDPATVALADAERIVAGGLGLGGPAPFDRLARVGRAFGAALGGTRVAADHGWIPFERQIGTTGVTVHPALYLALGISGAVQHTAGIDRPRHVVAVNTDASAPIMGMADLAIVSDAVAVVEELHARLVGPTPGEPAGA